MGTDRRLTAARGSRRRHGEGRDGEAGFTIVEAMIAASILLVVLAGFGSSLGTGFTGSRDNQVTQQATAVAVDRLEFARSLSWDELAMTSVGSGAPGVNKAEQLLVGSEVDLPDDEALIVDAATGQVDPMTVETLDGTSYTVWTTVSSTADGYRRVVVIVEFRLEGVVSYHRNSTLISEAATR